MIMVMLMNSKSSHKIEKECKQKAEIRLFRLKQRKHRFSLIMDPENSIKNTSCSSLKLESQFQLAEDIAWKVQKV